jgi:hypothetical protein
MNILAVLSEEHVPRNYEQGEKVIKWIPSEWTLS